MEEFSEEQEREEMISKITHRLFDLTNDQLIDVNSYLSILGFNSQEDSDSSCNSNESSYENEESELDVNSQEYQDLLKKLSSIKLPSIN